MKIISNIFMSIIRFVFFMLLLLSFCYAYNWWINIYKMNELAENFILSTISFGIKNFEGHVFILMLSMSLIIVASLAIISQINYKVIKKKNLFYLIIPAILAPILTHTGIYTYKYMSNDDLIYSYYSEKMYEIISKNDEILPDNKITEQFINYRDTNSAQGIEHFEKNKEDILSISEVEIKKINLVYKYIDNNNFKNKIDDLMSDRIITIKEYKDLKEFLKNSDDESLIDLNFLI